MLTCLCHLVLRSLDPEAGGNLGRRQSAAYVCQAAAIRKAEETGLLFGK